MSDPRKIIKVLVVDNSAAARMALSRAVNAAEGMRVTGTAGNVHEAREAMKVLRPDVMVLDADLPHIDTLEFLDRITRIAPLPIVLVANSTERDSEMVLKAMESGSVDFVSKRRRDATSAPSGYVTELCDKIRAAHEARKSPFRRAGDADIAANKESAGTIEADAPLSMRALNERLVFIGASTGGTEAIKEVLIRMPEKSPGILIVQHMPEMFTESFAKRLDGLCRIQVKEARDGDKVQPGVAYIAPGHSHLSVKKVAGAYFCELQRGPPVNRHRPSVDVLFHSAARHVGAQGVGVMLTGMGKDGAGGMLAMRQAGCYNICQDQESCVVWGMPREATLNGAAHEVAALKDIAGKVLARLRSMENRFA